VPLNFQIPGFSCVPVNEHEIEVEVFNDQNLNQLFAALSNAGVQINSMRNKSNRLEELFMRLVERRDKELTGKIADPEVAV
jgi:ABC-2 type transport system ATP-binding protein